MKNNIARWRGIPLSDRLLHVHIPKTGGNWFNNILRLHGVNIYDHLCISNCLGNFSHSYARASVDQFYVAGYDPLFSAAKRPGTYDAACKVSIVRNPFDWFVSYYHHREDNVNHKGWDNIVSIHGIQSFPEFVEKFCDPNFRWSHPWIQRCGPFYQACNNDGTLGVDFLLKNEELNFATESLFLQLDIALPGWRPPTTRLKHSSLRKRDYRFYYTDRLRELMTAQFSVELQQLGYGFDGSLTSWGIRPGNEVKLSPLKIG